MVPGREEVGWGKAGELGEPGEGLVSLGASPAPTGHPDLSCKWAVGLKVGTHMDRGRNCQHRASFRQERAPPPLLIYKSVFTAGSWGTLSDPIHSK